ncbi:MAG: hypothetical protein ACOCWQ_02430 [Nanoarchaeota archaeon]
MEQQQLLDFIFDGDDITWQSMIFEAVRSEQMDPWDIDIHTISGRFMAMLASLKDMNLRIPGKVLLASAILLKLKSDRFIDVDMNVLDRLIAYTEGDADTWEEDDGEYDDLEGADAPFDPEETPKLVPRTPQPRRRKVSVYDLVKALEKALEVKNRRKVLSQKPEPKVQMPNKIFDLSLVLNDVYSNVVDHYDKNQGMPLTFSKMIPSASRDDKVFTFIPLLHLCNMRKVDLHQEEHFGDFEIELLSNQRDISKEVAALEMQTEDAE